MPGAELDEESKQHLIYLISLRIFPRSEARTLMAEWLQEEEFAKSRNSVLRFLGLDYAMTGQDLLFGLENAIYSCRTPITIEDHLKYLFSLRIFDAVGDEDWARLRKEGCIQAWLNFLELADGGEKIRDEVRDALGLESGRFDAEAINERLEGLQQNSQFFIPLLHGGAGQTSEDEILENARHSET